MSAPDDGPPDDGPPEESPPDDGPPDDGPPPDGPDAGDSAPQTGATGDGPDGSAGATGADGSDPAEDDSRRRRPLLLLLLLLIVLVGGGVGTFVFDTQPDEQPGVETPSTTPGATGTLTLTATTDATLLSATGVVPGDNGTSRLALRNTGERPGKLAVANVTVDGAENGLTTPEATGGDSAGSGELADALRVRLSVRYGDGETVRVFGGDRYVPLAGIETRNRTVGALDAGEDVTVVFEWRLPSDTGNEVQGDTATFDIVFGLRDPAVGTAGQ